MTPAHGVSGFFRRPQPIKPKAGQESVWDFCEFKGEAQYYDAVAGGVVLPRAGWTYPPPTRGFEALSTRVALYPGHMDSCEVNGEQVSAQDGDFYGGWITRQIVGPFKGGPGTAGW